ncbi:homocysteine S-methyltransferase [Halobacillus karajensis]|uniref:Bifunctional homocysteine S-methyltransferase/5,10-methylenetetrahydrofolate reductase n=1 Tax=Halobacillus karajensis TaxID=195088 RepID=A0A024PAD9_9BACI|nr:bifunctional homocysteine S-methyltransferase/methylenetetrahydrofolate reductase [Halobacillus karajensis]CDQ21457.1 Bifunctional homocysteine S-methyltransferase/5,10-methylenetetrahydrofolate reductase [Halobacillus karajensis]CDQ25392.1 Bifunctional homocysteine S-methyltransferase/5,10-methylenetetrahydrofolate reductase [Halobacillus karajensis]CDQ29716.1 Bifunctional homocysteine S-methyltransferase/5,10-methylenetetrahydrofolate reductase [Halobacillus karajensis]SEI07852.1 homocyste
MNLRESLQRQTLIGDGAMGTLLYSYGVDRCFEELNLSHSEEVLNVHRAYVNAGADVIQTNTYGANYIKLARYDLQDQVKEINTAAVRLAKKAADSGQYVVGTIGGVRGAKKQAISLEEIKRSFREQLYCLLFEEVDGLLLETYYDLEELSTVLKIARKETSLPIITQVSMHEAGVLQDGTSLPDALKQLEQLGADVVGVNCRLGPYHTIQSLEEVPLPEHAVLSAYPNASLPAYQDGRLVYPTDPTYFQKSAQSLYEQGARLIGGCCGTTPEHIEAITARVKGKQPIEEKILPFKEKTKVKESENKDDRPHPHEKARNGRSIIVELDPPKKLKTERFFQGASALQEAGVDSVTLADNSLASPRISNTAMASLIKEKYDIDPLVHIACRDRNLLGLQSHLMGLHTLGIRQLLAVTGDPTKIGDFPGATSVYDLNSFDLIHYIKQMNKGISFSGKSLGESTSFSVAAAFNPNVRNLNRAVGRLEKKIKYGADYFISQPVFNEEQIIEVYEATKHIDAPIYIGIMPLITARNAEFLHNEVPGITLAPDVLEKMELAGTDKAKAQTEGLSIAKSLIDTALDLFNGIYLITPFLRYEMTVELTNYIQEQTAKQQSLKRLTHSQQAQA